MPKLNAANAAVAQEKFEAGGGSFVALEPGIYTGRLAAVTPKSASTGSPMWVWEFDEIDDITGKRQPGRQWVNTVIVEQAMWKVGEMFAAFGADTDTDTDLLIGRRAQLTIVQRVIQAGAKQGEMGNDVRAVRPIEGAAAAAPAAAKKTAAAAAGSALEF